ncbi:MAG: ribbon-helix-helix protein, CopG family [Chloroflexi bacterium]|nr:ribbon-helix-helix protein, CopG family [Chloroflexota bacterium]
MQRMRRTQIYLPSDLSAALDHLARQRGTSRANLLRLAARRLLEQEQAGEEEDPIFGIIGLGDAGPGRVSEEHDRVLAEHRLKGRSR